MINEVGQEGDSTLDIVIGRGFKGLYSFKFS
jgi:hypothetical protein